MRTKIHSILIGLLFLSQNLIWSQNTVKELEGFRYKELIVNTASAHDSLPLIIGLHWMRSNPDEFFTFLKDIKKPARIILPEGRYPYKEGFSFYPVELQNYYKMDEDHKMNVLKTEGEKLADFIDFISKKYPSNKKPVIIGASQGGDLSYFIAVHHNTLIGLSCPLMATIDNRLINKAKTKPKAAIAVFHGENDPIVNINDAKKHIKLLKTNSFKAKINTYKEVKHDISDEMKSDFSKLIDNYLN
ncbi:alpha/beta hydrolase [Flavobacterium sp. H122]|uniref:alpha/beta hydrolase n=1 Tax=Flavobacterium sp. H122 TaxID=2529860 RepID=UPI0010AA08F7|nr:dienelactone hydrolase family protein [Flavobacterium sp. H122]